MRGGDLLRTFLLDKKSVPLLIKFFIKIRLPLGFTFRNKWETKIIVLSKSIALSHYKELGIT